MEATENVGHGSPLARGQKNKTEKIRSCDLSWETWNLTDAQATISKDSQIAQDLALDLLQYLDNQQQVGDPTRDKQGTPRWGLPAPVDSRKETEKMDTNWTTQQGN
jgi:hypothetical protein